MVISMSTTLRAVRRVQSLGVVNGPASATPKTTDAVKRPFIRFKLPVAILCVAAAMLVYVDRTPNIEDVARFRHFFGIFAATVLALGLWVLVSKLRWRAKLLILCTAVLIAVGGFLLATRLVKRVGTYASNGAPHLVWKWSRPADTYLAPALLTGRSQEIDLNPTPTDWPQFLGPRRDNAIDDPGLCQDWAAHPPRQLWRRPVGAGWGSFAIVNKFTFTQEQRGSQEITTCAEARTGAVRWQHANLVRFSDKTGGDGPRATPTAIDGRVYVMGATGILDCLDGQTGKALWSHNVMAETGRHNLPWGKSCSPLVTDGLVVVTGGAARGPTLLAYDQEDGNRRWEAGTDQAAYCSAAGAKLGGSPEVVVVAASTVSGFDRHTGTLRWTFPWPGNPARGTQPVPLPGDRIFVCAGYGLGCVMLHISTDRGRQSAQPLWSNKKLRTIFSNAVVYDGCIYGLDDGVLTCLDAVTGTRQWREGHYGHGQLLLVGNRLIVQAESGTIALVNASSKSYSELASFPALDGKTWNHCALSGHLLLTRNDHEAACFELP